MSKPLYRTARWKRRREAQLKLEPLCRYCLDLGLVTPANVVDHIIPHRYNPELFWYGKLQSLCTPHHNSTKQSEERLGYSNQIGSDGYPILK